MKRMSRTKQIAARRLKLWNRDPRCHWCGTPTVLPPPGAPGKLPENTATLDHLRSRYDPTRREPNPQCAERTVLACWKCNNEREKVESATISKSELSRRASGPARDKTVILRSIRRARFVIERTGMRIAYRDELIGFLDGLLMRIGELDPTQMREPPEDCLRMLAASREDVLAGRLRDHKDVVKELG